MTISECIERCEAIRRALNDIQNQLVSLNNEKNVTKFEEMDKRDDEISEKQWKFIFTTMQRKENAKQLEITKALYAKETKP